eukprot:COSAG01_NODE_37758_length_499_cov_0.900000_2_plen_30_part_01
MLLLPSLVVGLPALAAATTTFCNPINVDYR